ncbi:MAG: hypothetical protein ACRDZU_00665, partial [Acidimicrobiales bacterium]
GRGTTVTEPFSRQPDGGLLPATREEDRRAMHAAALVREMRVDYSVPRECEVVVAPPRRLS